MRAFWNKMKTRWGVKSDLDVFLILLAFAITGSSILKVSSWMMEFFGITDPSYSWVRWVIAFPVYQVLLLIVGACLGQFKFFWDKEKKLLNLFGRLFGR